MKTVLYFLLVPLVFCFSCATSKESFDPNKKYPPAQLAKDYQIFRAILEESHPGLYWYTPKDSMDHYFDLGYSALQDSMTEGAFRNVLTYVATKINCGHTSVAFSKKYSSFLDTARILLFPLGLKFWGDTMIVTANINRNDSVIRRGTVIESINGMSQQQLRDTLFNYMATDGYSLTGKYQSLSNGFNFGSWYRNIFGLQDQFDIRYFDEEGISREARVPVYDPVKERLKKDSFSVRRYNAFHRKDNKRQRLFSARNLQIDTAGSTAFMTLNTFAHGNHLKRFFRKSFRTFERKHIQDLVIDLRSNGGGDANNSTLLTRYIIDKKFKIADSLYAVDTHSKYDKYIGKSGLYRWLMAFVTKKEQDGKYHFGFFERHYYEPIVPYHYKGNVYLLIGGNTFSATTLFAGAIKGQKNVTLIGEETGGGYYGNNAWMIPEVTLPYTGLRFRLPKFRLVVDKNRIKDGHGVLPDIVAMPTSAAIRGGIDFKVAKVEEVIRMRRAAGQQNAALTGGLR